MRRIIKQVMIAALFAVAMLGGGEVPILHAPHLADAHAFAHQQMDAARGDVHHAGPAQLDVASLDADHDDPLNQSPGSDRGCTHAHAHCCASTAILAPFGVQPPEIDAAPLRLQRNAALPYGQLSRPPHRPPRLTA